MHERGDLFHSLNAGHSRPVACIWRWLWSQLYFHEAISALLKERAWLNHLFKFGRVLMASSAAVSPAALRSWSNRTSAALGLKPAT